MYLGTGTTSTVAIYSSSTVNYSCIDSKSQSKVIDRGKGRLSESSLDRGYTAVHTRTTVVGNRYRNELLDNKRSGKLDSDVESGQE